MSRPFADIPCVARLDAEETWEANLRSTLAEWPTAERLVVSRSVLEGLLRDLTAARDASHLRPRPVDVGREEWT